MTKDNIDKQEIETFLENINSDLCHFIENRIQQGVVLDKNWSLLFKELEHKRCWEVFSCTKMNCPARNLDSYQCWLVAGTLCGGKIQGVFAKKFGSCLKCKFYKGYHITPARSLFENINILISYMSDESYEFHRKATTDSLTGLLNRASFDEISEVKIKRGRRQNTSLALVMFDLDHFKEINDESGHVVGDFYLIEFASILRRVSRETDFVFRTGGDEFIVMLVDTEEKNIYDYIKRVQESIALWNKSENRPYPYLLAASAGGSYLNDLSFDIQKCMEMADQRMYQNKQDRKA